MKEGRTRKSGAGLWTQREQSHGRVPRELWNLDATIDCPASGESFCHPPSFSPGMETSSPRRAQPPGYFCVWKREILPEKGAGLRPQQPALRAARDGGTH